MVSVCIVFKIGNHNLPFLFREDVVEVDSWVAPSGKNGMRRDWHVRDYRTGKTVLRATRLVSAFSFTDSLMQRQQFAIVHLLMFFFFLQMLCGLYMFLGFGLPLSVCG